MVAESENGTGLCAGKNKKEFAESLWQAQVRIRYSYPSPASASNWVSNISSQLRKFGEALWKACKRAR